jgi:hypothetical protein
MRDDAVLELDLREPLGVDGGELLLGLELVLEDAVHLREAWACAMRATRLLMVLSGWLGVAVA